MPSPFPGMDPFIESQAWSDFHGAAIFAMRAVMAPELGPNYFVRGEDRVYLERPLFEPIERIPDIHIAVGKKRLLRKSGGMATIDAEADLFDIPVSEEHHEHYLVIRDKKDRRVVTVVELLSPANKKPGSRGMEEYYEKRDEVLRSRANLVEIDLLRGGKRPATIQPLAEATDYCVLVHRAQMRPKAKVYQWGLRDPLPTIRIPLAGNDPDYELDLSTLFATVYDTGSYQYSLDYSDKLSPPLRKADVPWVRQITAAVRG
jgi:uncharacterized protein DUF4058